MNILVLYGGLACVVIAITVNFIPKMFRPSKWKIVSMHSTVRRRILSPSYLPFVVICLSLVTMMCLVAYMYATKWITQEKTKMDASDASTVVMPNHVFKISGNQSRLKIPKIFHQTYATNRVMSAYKGYIAKCLQLNPDWEYYLWRDEDIVAFIKDHFPQFMRKYKHFYMYVQRGDCIRYMVLHHFGGIYVDMDVECVKPFFPKLANYTAFVDQEAVEHSNILYSKSYSAMNSAMGSVKGHPFFLRMVSAMMEVDDKVKGAGDTTGPDLLTAEITKWWQRRDGLSEAFPVTMLEPEIFSPLVDIKIHDFRFLCSRILSGAERRKIMKNPEEQSKKLLRERGCEKFAKTNYAGDKSTGNTVGRHLFLHLGYDWGKFRSKAALFDIAELRPSVKFYNKHHRSNFSNGNGITENGPAEAKLSGNEATRAPNITKRR